MINKQIIIDNVDVSECKNFSCGTCEEENKIPRTINHFTADCRMYPNCYYKQLKRAEQKLANIKEYCKPKIMMNGTANEILKIIDGKDNE